MKAAELTKLASDWLAEQYPDSVIVTELSVATWGGASIDIAAITENEIIGVEVKGEGDSPSRLPLQGHVYSRVASRMWLLADESINDRCQKHRPHGWGRLEILDGSLRAYNLHKKQGNRIEHPNGSYSYEQLRCETSYRPDKAETIAAKCPWSLCGTLWRDELYDLALRCGLLVSRTSREHDIVQKITGSLPAPRINDEVIRSLNLRKWKKPVRDLRADRKVLAVQGGLL